MRTPWKWPWFLCLTDLLALAVLAGMPAMSVAADLSPSSLAPTLSKVQSLPVVDLSQEDTRQVVIARGTNQIYQGHPHTLLLPDGKTLFAAWTYGHGGACGPLKRSRDGGLTWSDLLPVPENWSTVRNCPTLHRIVGPDDVSRIFVFAGNGAMYQSVSRDEGQTFSPMKPNGLKTIVAPISIEAVDNGRKWLMWYHRGSSEDLVDEGADKTPRSVWQSASTDGGLTWGDSHPVCTIPGAYPCEPAVIRSPDGKQLLMMIRENTRKFNSLFIVSNDEGQSWSAPQELTAALTGDRHLMQYAPDGRMVVVFRDLATGATKGHFVGWVGTYDDVLKGHEGQYRIKLLHHYGRPLDTGYPGLEVLPDGTFVATTYCQLAKGEKNSVVSVRFQLPDLDKRFQQQAKN